MKSRCLLVLIAALTLIAGCAESTLIRSHPMGARISVDGSFVGTAPVVFSVPRDRFTAQEFTVTAEYPGYETGRSTLRKQTCPGRIVGAVFSLGISLIFKRPTCFEDPKTVSLVALPAAPAGAAQPSVEERLEQLEALRRAGRLTPQEYQQLRRDILDDL
jgi:hypothetical protein